MSIESPAPEELDLAHPWMSGLHAAPVGFYVNAAGAGIGAVLVVREKRSGTVLVVVKAVRPGYEFSGRCAFPGGMVRWMYPGEPFASACVRSLTDRVMREAGFELAQSHEPAVFAVQHPPPVTSYSARGARRHTVVLAFSASVERQRPLRTMDASVSEVRWLPPAEALSAMAPANTVIGARLLGAHMAVPERRHAAAAVQSARKCCDAWAAEIGLPTMGNPCFAELFAFGEA